MVNDSSGISFFPAAYSQMTATCTVDVFVSGGSLDRSFMVNVDVVPDTGAQVPTQTITISPDAAGYAVVSFSFTPTIYGATSYNNYVITVRPNTVLFPSGYTLSPANLYSYITILQSPNSKTAASNIRNLLPQWYNFAINSSRGRTIGFLEQPGDAPVTGICVPLESVQDYNLEIGLNVSSNHAGGFLADLVEKDTPMLLFAMMTPGGSNSTDIIRGQLEVVGGTVFLRVYMRALYKERNPSGDVVNSYVLSRCMTDIEVTADFLPSASTFICTLQLGMNTAVGPEDSIPASSTGQFFLNFSNGNVSPTYFFYWYLPQETTELLVDNMSFSNAYTCVGGYNFNLCGQAYADDGSQWCVQDRSQGIDGFYTSMSINSFSIRTATEGEIRSSAITDIQRAVSVDDAIAMGISSQDLPVDFSSYIIFIVPSNIVPDPTILNQAALASAYSNTGGISPASRIDATLVSPSVISDVLDGTLVSPNWQNTYATQVVINGRRLSSQGARTYKPIIINPYPDNTLVVGFEKPFLIVANTLYLTNLRVFPRVLSAAESTTLNTATQDEGKPVFFFRPFDVDQTTGIWRDFVNPTTTFITCVADALYGNGLYPNNQENIFSSSGQLTLFNPVPIPLQITYAGNTSTTLNLDTLDIFTGTTYTTPAYDGIRTQTLGLRFVGKADQRFVNQKLGSPKMLAYCEGPPPMPSENMTLCLTGTYTPAQLAATIYQKTTQSTYSLAARYYASEGSTQNASGHAGPQWRIRKMIRTRSSSIIDLF